MRKEIIGLILLFLILFTLISLFSHHPADPSVHNATDISHVHNRFGLAGSYFSGMLIGFFGVGAFWTPLLLVLVSIHYWRKRSKQTIALTVIGGIILVITTGGLFGLRLAPANELVIWGRSLSAGGIAGILLQLFLEKYTNTTGALIILILAWLIGFIMVTGFSLSRFIWQWMSFLTVSFQRGVQLWVKWKQNRPHRATKRPEKRLLPKKIPLEKEVRESHTKPRKDLKEFNAPDFDILLSEPPKKISPTLIKSRVRATGLSESGFQLPNADFLNNAEKPSKTVSNQHLQLSSKMLQQKLDDFNVTGQVVAAQSGPVITTFEFQPAAGVKINKIVNLSDDLALAMRAASIRIVAPIPGKAAVGIEVPNATRQLVNFKDVVSSQAFKKSNSPLTIGLGKDIVGQAVVAALDKMPHLLIAGATGTGKSVGLNSMICSLLYKSSPDEMKLLMVDPKRIEFSMYDGIPHLITPVVTAPEKATNALFWAVNEMERRYELLAQLKARNLMQYNQYVEKKMKNAEGVTPPKEPFIVIIIDELADLMMVASRDVEVSLTRLAQMARAAGIHLILATQRPSVDVLTGLIKANFPTRLSFQVSSRTDSRTIIDGNGAETLLGDGDMLFLPPGTAKLQRIHGAYISDKEIERLIVFLKNQGQPNYDMDITHVPTSKKTSKKKKRKTAYDARYDDAVAFISQKRQASVTMLQRHLRIGYKRAASIMEAMEAEGLVGPSEGVKPREVLIR